jgi:hypothetical protein
MHASDGACFRRGHDQNAVFVDKNGLGPSGSANRNTEGPSQHYQGICTRMAVAAQRRIQYGITRRPTPHVSCGTVFTPLTRRMAS